jgi:hypothetical protein
MRIKSDKRPFAAIDSQSNKRKLDRMGKPRRGVWVTAAEIRLDKL